MATEYTETDYHAFKDPELGAKDYQQYLSDNIQAYDERIVKRGALADRPAASKSGRIYISTDSGQQTVYLDTGNSWVAIAGTQMGNQTIRVNEVHADAGSATDPSYTFDGDTDTGWYSPSADVLRASTGGVLAVDIDASQNIAFPNGHLTLEGNWRFDSESEGGVERLRLQATGVDDPAELFLQAKGAANASRITVTPDSDTTNFAGLTLESNGTDVFIDSIAEGTATALPLKLKMAGVDAVTVRTDEITDVLRQGRVKHSAASFVAPSTFAAEPALIVVPDSENQRGSAIHMVPNSDPAGTGVDSDKADIHWMTRQGEIVARIGAHEADNHFSVYTRDGTAYDGTQGGHLKRLDIDGGAAGSSHVHFQNFYRFRLDNRGAASDIRHEYQADDTQDTKIQHYQGSTLFAEHGFYGSAADEYQWFATPDGGTTMNQVFGIPTAGHFDVYQDLRDAAGNVIYDQTNQWVNQARLENDTVTVAGNAVALGGSTAVSGKDLSDSADIAYLNEAETVSADWHYQNVQTRFTAAATTHGFGSITHGAPLEITGADGSGAAAWVPGDNASGQVAHYYYTRSAEYIAKVMADSGNNQFAYLTRQEPFDGTQGTLTTRLTLGTGDADTATIGLRNVRDLEMDGRALAAGNAFRVDTLINDGEDAVWRFREDTNGVMASIYWDGSATELEFYRNGQWLGVTSSAVQFSRYVAFDGSARLNDDKTLQFGSVSDYSVHYDSAEDRIEFWGTNEILRFNSNDQLESPDGSRVPSSHEAPNAHIPMSEIPDGDHIEIVVQVPTGGELLLWAWGAQDDSQNAPTGLDVKLVDVSTGSTLTSENTKHTTGTPIWTHTASDPIALRLSNSTGSAINASAFFSYTIE